MNWLLISVGILFLVCMIVGYVRGVLRIGVSLLATIGSIVLVLVLTPMVGNVIDKYSPVEDMVATKCTEVFMGMIPVETLQSLDLSETSIADLDEDELANLDVEEAGLTLDDISIIMGEIPKEMQINAIEDSTFPTFLKNALLENNNSEVYKELGVTAFPQYIASYITKILINILAFLVTFLLVTIIVRALIVAVDIISDLPILGLATRITGALVGALIALVIVWIFFLIITAACTTNFGKDCFVQIGNSAILRLLYENNYILKFLMSF